MLNKLTGSSPKPISKPTAVYDMGISLNTSIKIKNGKEISLGDLSQNHTVKIDKAEYSLDHIINKNETRDPNKVIMQVRDKNNEGKLIGNITFSKEGMETRVAYDPSDESAHEQNTEILNKIMADKSREYYVDKKKNTESNIVVSAQPENSISEYALQTQFNNTHNFILNDQDAHVDSSMNYMGGKIVKSIDQEAIRIMAPAKNFLKLHIDDGGSVAKNAKGIDIYKFRGIEHGHMEVDTVQKKISITNGKDEFLTTKFIDTATELATKNPDMKIKVTAKDPAYEKHLVERLKAEGIDESRIIRGSADKQNAVNNQTQPQPGQAQPQTQQNIAPPAQGPGGLSS